MRVTGSARSNDPSRTRPAASTRMALGSRPLWAMPAACSAPSSAQSAPAARHRPDPPRRVDSSAPSSRVARRASPTAAHPDGDDRRDADATCCGQQQKERLVLELQPRRAPEAAAAVAIPEEPPHRHHELCVPARRGPSCAPTGGTRRRPTASPAARHSTVHRSGLDAEVAQPKADVGGGHGGRAASRTPSAPDPPTPRRPAHRTGPGTGEETGRRTCPDGRRHRQPMGGGAERSAQLPGRPPLAIPRLRTSWIGTPACGAPRARSRASPSRPSMSFRTRVTTVAHGHGRDQRQRQPPVLPDRGQRQHGYRPDGEQVVGHRRDRSHHRGQRRHRPRRGRPPRHPRCGRSGTSTASASRYSASVIVSTRRRMYPHQPPSRRA